MGRVPYIDQSGLYAMDEVIQSLREEGVVVVIAGLQEQPKLMLEKINVIPGLINENYIFDNFEACLYWLKPYLEQEKLGDLAEEQV
jgi:SulP family sulfate permease